MKGGKGIRVLGAEGPRVRGGKEPPKAIQLSDETLADEYVLNTGSLDEAFAALDAIIKKYDAERGRNGDAGISQKKE